MDEAVAHAKRRPDYWRQRQFGQHGGRTLAAFLTQHTNRIGYPHFTGLRYLGQEPRCKGRLEREEVYCPCPQGRQHSARPVQGVGG